MAYSILRFGKLKSRSQIKASQTHCDRTRETKNADPETTPLNRRLLGSVADLCEQVEAILRVAEQKRKIRPDANWVCEILLTASPEWFHVDNDLSCAIELEKVNQFAERAIEFLKREFGSQCLSAVLHLDETTPHIHAHFVPLHREKGWLSWEDWFGGREKLQQWQDKFAACLEPINLQRGIKGTIADHEHIQDFYGRINQSIVVPDLEQELCLPQPLAQETAAAYHQRASEFLVHKLPALQDAFSTVAAHAKNEAFALRKAKETRLTLHSLSDKVDQLEHQLMTTQTTLKTLNQKQKDAIAQELITTANLILNLAERNYWKGRQYIFSRRRGFTKIDTRDGRRLVHNQAGIPALTEHFSLSELDKIRQSRDQVLMAIAQQIEQRELQRVKRR